MAYARSVLIGETTMYWISDEQRMRALERVSYRTPTAREQVARARLMADRRRRVWYAGFALLVALVAAIFR
jgi:hypothetical protein